jgi:hypothetical protein
MGTRGRDREAINAAFLRDGFCFSLEPAYHRPCNMLMKCQSRDVACQSSITTFARRVPAPCYKSLSVCHQRGHSYCGNPCLSITTTVQTVYWDPTVGPRPENSNIPGRSDILGYSLPAECLA